MGSGIIKAALNRAVFLDRDGTVNEEVGYLTDVSKLRLIPGSGRAIRQLNDAGFKVVLVTNQSGVARGYFPEELVHQAHLRLQELLEPDGARIDAVYYCPHHPTAGNSHYTVRCECRKPGTGLIDQAVQELTIDRERSYMVGDKWSDVELGQRAGVHAVLVLSGFAPDDPGNKRPEGLKEPDCIAHSLTEAVVWILSREADVKAHQ
jgi:D-glycero-D-manno-heptose 1,7-bisphosphate phosphatase